jgi:hypothetical protein
MKRKEFIEYLEGLRSKAAVRISELMSAGDTESLNYQLGKSAAYRTAIEKLKEQDEKEAGE